MTECTFDQEVDQMLEKGQELYVELSEFIESKDVEVLHALVAVSLLVKTIASQGSKATAEENEQDLLSFIAYTIKSTKVVTLQ